MEAEQEMELEPVTALQLLQSVYQNPTVGLTTRMRAAMACLPFEVPKLAVTALISESDFATVLDRRLKHLEEIRNGKLIEAQPEPEPIEAPQTEVKAPTPSINFRSLRRRI
jgi:hypothetical protein